MNVPINLKIELIKRGLSQAAFAKRVGYDPAFINQIINGWRIPSEAVKKKILEEFDADASIFDPIGG